MAAPTSWIAAGSEPTRRGVPGATRTTSDTEESALFRPPTARTDVPTRASPGSCTGAGSERVPTTCRPTPSVLRAAAVPAAGDVAAVVEPGR